MSDNLIMGDIFVREGHCPLLYIHNDLFIFGWNLGKNPSTENLMQYSLNDIAANWTKVGNIKDILHETAVKGGIISP